MLFEAPSWSWRMVYFLYSFYSGTGYQYSLDVNERVEEGGGSATSIWDKIDINPKNNEQ